jgi:RNA polymerase sigma-70 factor (ECF subfamily)
MSIAAATVPMVIDPPTDGWADLRREFARSGDALHRYFAARLGADASSADDLMQQLWMQAARGATQVPAAELEFWLRRAARNLLATHWRKQRTRATTELNAAANGDEATRLAQRFISTALPADELERIELHERLKLAITSLPTAEQELLIRHYFEGASHAAIAEAIGISERAVEGRLYRARALLRERMTRYET